MTPSDDLRARVLAAAAEEPSPTRRGRLARSLLFTVVITAISFGVFRLKGRGRARRPGALDLVLGLHLSRGHPHVPYEHQSPWGSLP
jgi:hypothetical protein